MIRVGDIVKVFGEEFEVLEIAPRIHFAKMGLEPTDMVLLGMGIIGLNEKTKEKEYFYDFDVDEINGQLHPAFIPD